MTKVICWGLAAGVLIVVLLVNGSEVSSTVGYVSEKIMNMYDQHVLDRHTEQRYEKESTPEK